MCAHASITCPDWEQLEAALAASERDPVLATHLETCSDCRERLAELRANNRLLQDVLAASRTWNSGIDGAVSQVPAQINGYELLGEIHHGGQGIVYKGVQLATRRTVAIKVLLEGRWAMPTRYRRFQREIEVVAALRDPSIVTVYDSGLTADGRLFFAMEFVDGSPLHEFVGKVAPPSSGAPVLPIHAALGLFCAICDGVNHAHQRGVIHRDLKPSNILVDPEHRPHIVDFGLAKAVGDESAVRQQSLVTAAGQFMGTLAYAAPEQLRGDADAVDVRTDVYALGVILYELLTGRLPYPAGKTLSDTIRAITDFEPAPPSLLHPSSTGALPELPSAVDDELDTIVLKTLAKDPQRRYQTAGALGDDIRRYLRGDPIDARRDNAWYVLKKTIYRHRLSAAVGAAFLVLLLAFGVGMSLMYGRTKLEAEKARQIKVFLEDTLGSVAPTAQGAEVTVRQMLDEAVHWVEIALRGQPEVEASLRTTIGNSYRTLGLYELAEYQLTLAHQTHRQLFGDEHPLVAQSINALGALARDRGDGDRALELFERGLAMRRRLFGNDHIDVTISLQNLGSVRVRRGELSAAEVLFRESLSIRKRLLGEAHPDIAMAQFELAEVLRLAGRLDEAELLHRSALETRRMLLHEEHPDFGRSLLAMGRTLIAHGRSTVAVPLLRECLDRQTRAVPVSRPRVAEIQLELGYCLAVAGQFQEAEQLLLESYEILRSTTAERDSARDSARRRLVELYEQWGRPDQAERYRPASAAEPR
jgi:serine/threonine protein kinase